MLMRSISLFLVCALFLLSGTSLALANGSKESKAAKREAKLLKHSLKVKKAVLKLGTGKDAVVKLKLRDKTKIKGYITEINETNFMVVDEAGNTHLVDYRNTKQIRGNNLHAGVWVAIGVGIAIIAILITLNIVLADS